MSARSINSSIKILNSFILKLQEEGLQTSNLKKILAAAKPEWKLITLGLIGGAIRGAVMPAFAFVYSDIFSVSSRLIVSMQ